MRPVSNLTIGITRDHAATILYWTEHNNFLCAFHRYNFDSLFPFSLLFILTLEVHLPDFANEKDYYLTEDMYCANGSFS